VRNELVLDPAEHLGIKVTNANPTPVTVEPWGMVLFLLPNSTYVLYAGELDGIDGQHREAALLSLAKRTYSPTEAITLWLGGGDYSLYRVDFNGAPVAGLVWESKRPSRLMDLFTDEKLLATLSHIDRAPTSEYDEWSEQEFAEIVTPIAQQHNRWDIVLLLHEYGMIQKLRGLVFLTEFGHEFLEMHFRYPFPLPHRGERELLSE
jgi:hypothetical protein